MKHLKKLAGVLLALVMVMALGAPAFASDAPAAPDGDPSSWDGKNPVEVKGTITVTNAVEGATSKLYRIFDLVEYNRDTNAFLYKINENWGGFFADPATDAASGRNYVDIDEDGYVTWKNNADVKAFAKAALDWADANGVNPVGSKVANSDNGTNKVEEEGKLPTWTLTFTDLPLGYYLLNSSDGAVCSLNTAAPNVTIENKNPQSVIEKKPVDTSTMVGKVLEFNTEFKAYPTGIQYKVTDTIRKGLSFSDEQFKAMTITVGETKYEGTEAIIAAGITVTKTDAGFEVNFPKEYVANLLEDGVDIVIHYEMTVTAEGVTVVENDATLNYGEDFEVTDDSKAEVPTYCFNLVKLNGNSMKQIEGAKFKLYDSETGADPIWLIKEDGTAHEGDDAHDYQYRVATQQEIDDQAEGLTDTIEAGNVVVAGLKAGTYWLEETEPPAGYNPIDGRQSFTIVDADLMSNAANADGTFDADTGVKVLNKTGSLLPSTGGIGTTLFYVVGGVLVLGAVVLLITKRRTSVDDE